jgi:hypothetical protein
MWPQLELAKQQPLPTRLLLLEPMWPQLELVKLPLGLKQLPQLERMLRSLEELLLLLLEPRLPLLDRKLQLPEPTLPLPVLQLLPLPEPKLQLPLLKVQLLESALLELEQWLPQLLDPLLLLLEQMWLPMEPQRRLEVLREVPRQEPTLAQLQLHKERSEVKVELRTHRPSQVLVPPLRFSLELVQSPLLTPLQLQLLPQHQLLNQRVLRHPLPQYLPNQPRQLQVLQPVINPPFQHLTLLEEIVCLKSLHLLEQIINPQPL